MIDSKQRMVLFMFYLVVRYHSHRARLVRVVGQDVKDSHAVDQDSGLPFEEYLGRIHDTAGKLRTVNGPQGSTELDDIGPDDPLWEETRGHDGAIHA